MNGEFCTFFVDDLYVGIPVQRVQEVLRFQPMTAVALAPDVIQGLINLRGEIVIAIDLRRRLGMKDRAATDEPPTNIIVRTESGPVSFLVDAINDVVSTDPSTFEPTPATLTGTLRDLTIGVYKLEERLLLILDHEGAADVAQSREDEERTAVTPRARLAQ